MTYTKAQYKRAFEIACDFLNRSTIYGIDTDTLFDLIMQEYGIVSTFLFQKFILEHLDRFDDNDEVRIRAIERLGW
jgi:hypothetical protein